LTLLTPPQAGPAVILQPEGSSFYTTVNSGAMPLGAAKLSAATLALIKA
jgi:hypothetical protein